MGDLVIKNAIEVEGLSKRYRLGTAVVRPASRLARVGQAMKAPFQYLIRTTTKAKEEETLWALQDVSLTIAAGEVVGIIGRNGAGKTTLLKILSRITDPTDGRARVYGRVGTLLAVGTGFHPELSGRDNVFLNGAIMGMRREEIKSRFEEIVEFAEVAKFIDTPVKYYSSGMYVRLAFAVAAHLEPEVLLVDEVLAVGDLSFQRKCLGKMGSVAGEGRTVLLVSHNMESILGLCPRSIWIHQGGVRADGSSRDVIQAYTSEIMDRSAEVDLGEREQTGGRAVLFTGISLRDENGVPVPHAVCGEGLELAVDFESPSGQDLRNLSVWINVRDPMRRLVTTLWTMLTNQDPALAPGKGRLICRVPRLGLAPGRYTLDLAATVNSGPSDKVGEAAQLEVMPGDFFGTGRALPKKSLIMLDHSWTLEDKP